MVTEVKQSPFHCHKIATLLGNSNESLARARTRAERCALEGKTKVGLTNNEVNGKSVLRQVQKR